MPSIISQGETKIAKPLAFQGQCPAAVDRRRLEGTVGISQHSFPFGAA